MKCTPNNLTHAPNETHIKTSLLTISRNITASKAWLQLPTYVVSLHASAPHPGMIWSNESPSRRDLSTHPSFSETTDPASAKPHQHQQNHHHHIGQVTTPQCGAARANLECSNHRFYVIHSAVSFCRVSLSHYRFLLLCQPDRIISLRIRVQHHTRTHEGGSSCTEVFDLDLSTPICCRRKERGLGRRVHHLACASTPNCYQCTRAISWLI